MAQWILQSEGEEGEVKDSNERRGETGGRNRKEGFLLTGNAAVNHPADHAEQEEQITHEVAVISTSCRGETNILITFVCLFVCFRETKGNAKLSAEQ